MLERQREETVLRVLGRQEFVTHAEIQELTGVSEATVRRDLSRLQKRGMIKRLRGGACLVTDSYSKKTRDGSERPFAERVGVLAERKRRIGSAAARLCKDDQTLIVDGGSTTYYLSLALMSSKVAVITNSFAIARVLFDQSESRVIMPGGEINRESELVFDTFNSRFYDDYIADIAFIGAEGIDEHGLTNTQARLVHDERRMMKQAKRVVVLADSNKFGRYGHIRLCTLNEVDTVITDKGLPEEYHNVLEDHGIEMILV